MDRLWTFGESQQRWLEDAWSALDPDWVRSVLVDVVSIPSPTGEERRLAEYLVGVLHTLGLEARYQAIHDAQGNAVGRMAGQGTGPALLLYAPIDTAFAWPEDADWMPRNRPDLELPPSAEEDRVTGLGAENPKGYVVAVLAALQALSRARVPFLGEVIAGFGAGGMPTHLRPGQEQYSGQGLGVHHMLTRGVRGDYAVIAKPGWGVAWEEVGLCWFEVTIAGALGYTGVRHVTDYQNPIVAAATVIQELEAWAPQYAASRTSGLVAPQISIGAIHGGWAHKPAFVPAACRLYVDVRVSPREDPASVRRAFAEEVAAIASRHPGIRCDVAMNLSIPGSHTPPENWIVQSAIRAWESVAGRPHRPLGNKSGATDANILRLWGVPTARIGMPPGKSPVPWDFSMGVVDVASILELSRALIYCAIDTATRTVDELPR